MFLKPAGIVQPWSVIAGIGVHGFEQGHLVVADPDASLAHDTLPAGSSRTAGGHFSHHIEILPTIFRVTYSAAGHRALSFADCFARRDGAHPPAGTRRSYTDLPPASCSELALHKGRYVVPNRLATLTSQPSLSALASHTARSTLAWLRGDRNRVRHLDPRRPNLPGHLQHPSPQRVAVLDLVPRAVAADHDA